MDSVINKINEMMNSGDYDERDWDGYIAEPIKKRTFEIAKIMAFEIKRDRGDIDVLPDNSGGIDIFWGTQNRLRMITIRDDVVVEFLILQINRSNRILKKIIFDQNDNNNKNM